MGRKKEKQEKRGERTNKKKKEKDLSPRKYNATLRYYQHDNIRSFTQFYIQYQN